VGEILDPGFAKPQGVEAYTTAEPEYGSPRWWEIQEKTRLHDLIQKITRESLIDIDKQQGISSEQKLSLKKEFTVNIERMNVNDFLKNRINYLKTLSKIIAKK